MDHKTESAIIEASPAIQRMEKTLERVANALDRLADRHGIDDKMPRRREPLRDGVARICRNLELRDEVTKVIADMAVALASNPSLRIEVRFFLEFEAAWDKMRAKISSDCGHPVRVLDIIDRHDPRLAKPA